MLTEPIVAGASYVDGDGDIFTDFTYIHALDLWAGFHKNFGVFQYSPNGSYIRDGGSVVGENCKYNLVRRHLPVPRGVYHVSDGDTQLKRELDAWIANGGKWEYCHVTVRSWNRGTVRDPQWVSYNFYRAVGCTQDREFPQPAPPPLQLREGAWYERRDGAKSTGPCRWRDTGVYKWRVDFSDGYDTYTDDGFVYSAESKSENDIVREIDPPAPPATPQPDPLQRPMTFADQISYLESLNDGRIHSVDESIAWLRNRAQG